ncbi:MAG: hypothetical protein V5789_05590 [Colwellia sp.]
MTNTINHTDKVQIEMSSALLSHLLASGILHFSDCKYLNSSAKVVIWHALLVSSTKVDTDDRNKKLYA